MGPIAGSSLFRCLALASPAVTGPVLIAVSTGSHMRWELRAVRPHQVARFEGRLTHRVPRSSPSQAATLHQIEPPRCTLPPSQPQPSFSTRANSPGNDPDSEPCLGIPWPTTPTVPAMDPDENATLGRLSLAKAVSRIGEAQF